MLLTTQFSYRKGPGTCNAGLSASGSHVTECVGVGVRRLELLK